MPRHALARKFDQKQAVPFTDVIDLDAPFVDLAPMNDDLLISTARCGNGHHSFHRNGTLAAAPEFDPHGAPPSRFMAGAGVSSQPSAARRPSFVSALGIVARMVKRLTIKRRAISRTP